MPSPRRRLRARRLDELTEGQRTHLETGHVFFTGEGYASDDDLQAAWDENRDDLLVAWIAKKPGTRPWAWWKFDAPERRQRNDGGVHPFDNPERTAHVSKFGPVGRAMTLYYGRPAQLCVIDDFSARYESETAYLRRLNLLTETERTTLAPDFNANSVRVDPEDVGAD